MNLTPAEGLKIAAEIIPILLGLLGVVWRISRSSMRVESEIRTNRTEADSRYQRLEEHLDGEMASMKSQQDERHETNSQSLNRIERTSKEILTALDGRVTELERISPQARIGAIEKQLEQSGIWRERIVRVESRTESMQEEGNRRLDKIEVMIGSLFDLVRKNGGH